MISLVNKYCVRLFGHELPEIEIVIILVSLSFISIFFITIITVFILRSVKISKERGLFKFKQEIEQEIANYLFSDFESFESMLNEDQKFRKRYLLIVRKKYLRYALIDVLINLHKSFSGEYAVKIEKLYVELQLYIDSGKKLNNPYWHIKAKGISEISNMRYTPLYNDVYKFINADHALLRNEAQMAALVFKGAGGLTFLDNYSFIVSEWQQICLMDILLKSEKQIMINNAWLQSQNTSVVLLALKIIRAYKIPDHYIELCGLLEHDNEKIVTETIITIGEIQEVKAKVILIKLFDTFNSVQKTESLKALIHIATDEDFPFLTSLLYFPDNQVAINAAIAIKNTGAKGTHYLHSLLTSNIYSEKIIRIIKHVTDPLIVTE